MYAQNSKFPWLLRTAARCLALPGLRSLWMLSRAYRRCVLFHHVADEPSPLTDGLGVRVTTARFRLLIDFLAHHYECVDLDRYLDPPRTGSKPTVLVTFDDAYRSVALQCAPYLKARGIPSVFYVNSNVLDHATIALDNLIAYVANTRGVQVFANHGIVASTLREVFAAISRWTSERRANLHVALLSTTGDEPLRRARADALYLDSSMIAPLMESGIEIGNHTTSHVHAEGLSADAELAHEEIAGNQRRLEELAARRIRSFSFPYGAPAAEDSPVWKILASTRHSTAFVVDGRHSPPGVSPLELSRVSLHAADAPEAFLELEVLPRMRGWRGPRTSRGRSSSESSSEQVIA